MTTMNREVRAALAGVVLNTVSEPPWPRRCGYCQAEVDPDQATTHWLGGFVSRCRRRQEQARAN